MPNLGMLQPNTMNNAYIILNLVCKIKAPYVPVQLYAV